MGGNNQFPVRVVTVEGGEVHFIESHAFIERNGALDMTATQIDNTLCRLDMTVFRDKEVFIGGFSKRSLQEINPKATSATEKSLRCPIRRH